MTRFWVLGLIALAGCHERQQLEPVGIDLSLPDSVFESYQYAVPVAFSNENSFDVYVTEDTRGVSGCDCGNFSEERVLVPAGAQVVKEYQLNMLDVTDESRDQWEYAKKIGFRTMSDRVNVMEAPVASARLQATVKPVLADGRVLRAVGYRRGEEPTELSFSIPAFVELQDCSISVLRETGASAALGELRADYHDGHLIVEMMLDRGERIALTYVPLELSAVPRGSDERIVLPLNLYVEVSDPVALSHRTIRIFEDMESKKTVLSPSTLYFTCESDISLRSESDNVEIVEIEESRELKRGAIELDVDTVRELSELTLLQVHDGREVGKIAVPIDHQRY